MIGQEGLSLPARVCAPAGPRMCEVPSTSWNQEVDGIFLAAAPAVWLGQASSLSDRGYLSSLDLGESTRLDVSGWMVMLWKRLAI